MTTNTTYIDYSSLVDDTPNRLSEEKSHYSLITERHIQAVWLEQKYFRALKTTNNEPITVISPGIWNSEAGPDFLKAHLQIGDRLVRGDVEIHLNDDGWVQHGHHIDPRYDNVTLHVSLWNPRREHNITTSSGTVIACSHLQDHLTIPLARIVNLIDLDLYPYRRFVGSGRCSRIVFGKMNNAQLNIFFHSAAQWRLKQKQRHLASVIGDNTWQYAGGIAQAVGYKHNSRAFLDLFCELLPFHDLPEEELLAIGMGACGFFESSCEQRWGVSTTYRNLQALWWQHQPNTLFQLQLRLDHIRPLNHPVRRLAYLSKLLTDPATPDLRQRLLYTWRSLWQPTPSKATERHLLASLLTIVPVYKDPYWNSHYTFGEQTETSDIPLMGQPLKKEILLNTGLPILYRDIAERSDPKEIAAFNAFYQTIRATPSSKAKYLRQRLFGEQQKGRMLRSASASQGALQLHRDFCIHYEASCEGCPFIDKMT
ncbi:hypothetical protein SCG7086_AL_00260 [Chlamydiales bacterium SCGC AG-110-P3]|nr:hypothetical protein SCG7086_AL_00260 [Chlamydiales bacterium SCGC AG-110-P3]